MENLIGKKVKDLRESKNFTTIELAEKSGVAQSTISQIENGKRNPSSHTLSKLAEALGTDLAGLLKSDKIDKKFIESNETEVAGINEESALIKMPVPKNSMSIKGKYGDIVISVRSIERDDSTYKREEFPFDFEEIIAQKAIIGFLNNNKKEIIHALNETLKTEFDIINKKMNKIKNLFDENNSEIKTDSD